MANMHLIILLSEGVFKWKYKLWLQCCQRLLRRLYGFWNIEQQVSETTVKGFLR